MGKIGVKHMKEIDARGLACPAPVLQTKTAVEQCQADHRRFTSAGRLTGV